MEYSQIKIGNYFFLPPTPIGNFSQIFHILFLQTLFVQIIGTSKIYFEERNCWNFGHFKFQNHKTAELGRSVVISWLSDPSFCHNPNSTSTQLNLTYKNWVCPPPSPTTTYHHKHNVSNISTVFDQILTKL